MPEHGCCNVEMFSPFRSRSVSRVRSILILPPLALATFSIACASAGAPPPVSGSTYGAERLLATPRPFQVGVISTDEDEYGAAFSRDGRTLYFVRRIRPGVTEQILFSRFSRGRWQTGRLAGFSGTTFFDGDPAIAPDEGRIIFSSNRPLISGQPTRSVDLWAVDRRTRGWSAPRRLDVVNDDETDQHPSLARAALYFASDRRGGAGGFDLYRAPAAGDGFGQPVPLGAPVNTAGDETDPFVAPDQRYVIFTATRPAGAGGRDLWITYQTATGWSDPEALSVNTPEDEYAASVTPDGRYLFFTRGRPGDLLQIDLAASGVRSESGSPR